MDLQTLLVLVEELREELLREVIQSVLKQSNSDGLIAYGGLAATERLARRVSARSGVAVELKRPIARMR
jgi:hypothetical protein